MSKKISSKTGALLVLSKKLNSKGFNVPKFIYFTKQDFIKDKNKIFNKIKKNFTSEIIIRSSSLLEDKDGKSNAGKFKSFPNLKINNKVIFNKIEEVISEFDSLKDQVIIQKFENEILYSGVIFTRDQNTNAPCNQHYKIKCIKIYNKFSSNIIFNDYTIETFFKASFIFSEISKFFKSDFDGYDTIQHYKKIFFNSKNEL
jgi:hypothetical protein